MSRAGAGSGAGAGSSEGRVGVLLGSSATGSGTPAGGRGGVARCATSSTPVLTHDGSLDPKDPTYVDVAFLEECAKGWHTTREEHNFWFDAAQIDGEVPKDLTGTFLRNGPGLSEVYGTPLKHPIDGDGMVCALTFVDGKAHFKSRFVESKHRREEALAQRLLYKGQMGSDPSSAVRQTVSTVASLLTTGGLPKLKFRNPSNTNVFYWGGKILTCYETGLPHHLDPHTLKTVGLDTLNDTLDTRTFSAHFRYDSEKDLLVTLSLRPALSGIGTIAFNEYDRKWNRVEGSLLNIPGMQYAHDFLLTDNWYIVQMSPFVKLSKTLAIQILCGLKSPGDSMKYYPDLPCRIVLIPRRRKGPVRQFDIPPCHIYHFGNVCDHDGKIDFSAVCLGPEFNMKFAHGIWLSNSDVAPGYLYKFHIDLEADTIKRTQLDGCSCEFPSVHPYRHIGKPTGVRNRFTYLMANDRGYNLPYQDVVKVDESGSQRQAFHSSGCVGEPVFVPRQGPASATKGDEDDGYVLVQMYEPVDHVTHFLVLDAKKLEAGPVCRLRMPTHITYGFHGTFTPDVFVTPPSRL